MIEYTKNHFEVVKSVDWSDVIDKIGFEFKNETVNFVAKNPKTPPTFALHSNYYPGSILKAFNEVKAELDVAEMHIYTSFGNNSSTYGRHKDTMNVLIVAAIGTVTYNFDNDLSYTLNPGDSVLITKGEYHQPVITEPRVTLSFSWN